MVKTNKKRDIRELDVKDLQQWVDERGFPAYRARQVHKWLWQRAARTIEEMSDLPKDLRHLLASCFQFRLARVDNSLHSGDQTLKYVFRLHDNQQVEGVLIPAEDRITACISSQVGCGLGCRFCATGCMGFSRNLSGAEIFDQVAILRNEAETKFERSLTNIVLMGMGEPLQNYGNVMFALERICSKDGLGISPRRINISTAGIVKKIRKMGDDGAPYRLAVSLHSARQDKRNELMPVGEKNSMESLIEAIRYYQKKTDKKITFEYVMLGAVNDAEADALRLVAVCRQVHCKVNLIDYNPVRGLEFRKAREAAVHQFVQTLEKNRIQVTRRSSRGADIGAACGQLTLKQKNPAT